MISADAIIKQYINEQLSERLPEIVAEQIKTLKPPPDWMTETQLADYWQLRNPEGQLTVHSIRSWSKREDNPLPYANMGEMKRYHRETVNQWAREEAERQRKKRQKTGTELHAVPQAS